MSDEAKTYAVSIGRGFGGLPEPLTLAELRAKVPGIRWTDDEIEAGTTAFRPFHVTDPGVPHIRISFGAIEEQHEAA